MKKYNNQLLAVIGLIIFAILSCKKSSFLDANPNQMYLIPKNIQDFQDILNYNSYSVPSLSVEATDDYSWIKDQIQTTYEPEMSLKIYTWNDDIWYGTVNDNWNLPYNEVLKTNIVLEGLNKITPESRQLSDWNKAKGSALFFRSFYFYHLLQLFAPVYDASTAANQWGIPLRLGTGNEDKIKRATLEESYSRVINDLKMAKDLLPNIPQYKSQPSAHAAAAMLARVYLSMGDFKSALNYSSECLGYSNALLDYNMDIIGKYNKEVIYSTLLSGFIDCPTVDGAKTSVDELLLSSYNSKDLRTTAFFQENSLGGKYFKGSYGGIEHSNLFVGIATDEIYLIRAECYARTGNIAMALSDLNTLMIKRWKNDGSWVPFTAASSDEVLQKILLERRKELVFRGLRWTDLRRLNKLGANVTLKRTLDNGTVITLPPNNLKYTYLIPSNVMSFHPDWLQNPR